MGNLISIIVPIFNAEKKLNKCIESILNQTYFNLELILINDGSNDNSLKICKFYQQKDKRVIVIDKKNEGVSATRNLGLEIAKGNFIGFVDSDDYLKPNMYEKMLNQLLLDKSEVSVLASYSIIKNPEMLNNDFITGENAIDDLIMLKFPTSLWAYLYSRNSIKDKFLNPSIHFFEDFELNYRILKDTKKVSIIKDYLYYYEIDENSTNSQNINDKRISSLAIYEEISNDLIAIDEKSVMLKKLSFFRSHILVSVILSLAKSHKDAEKKYFMIVKKNAKEMFLSTFFSQYVPISYKAILFLSLVSPKLTANLLYYFKYK